MSVPDAENGPTRIGSVWQTLQPQIPALREQFDVALRTFGTEYRELESAPRPGGSAGWQEDGHGEAVAKSTRLRDSRTDAVIVLISDGIDNVSPDAG